MALVWFRNSVIPGNLEEDLSLGRRALAVRRVEEAAITSRSPQFSKVFHCRKRSTPKVHMESSLSPRYICRQEAGPEGRSGVRIHDIRIYSYTGRLVFIRCAGICAYNTRGSRDITSGQPGNATRQHAKKQVWVWRPGVYWKTDKKLGHEYRQ